jgi:CxxC-x17-CxxC domain-containing protein
MGDFNRFNKGGNGGGGRGGFDGGRDRKPSFGGGFGRKNFGGGNRGGAFGGKPAFGDRGDREMFQTTCSECKNSCEVPFRPTGEKPVFCNDCFSSKRGGEERGGDRRPERRDFARPERRDAKPEIRFHDEASESKNTKKIESLENEIKNLNIKIESLSELFNSLQTKKAEVKTVEVKKVEETKKPATKKVATKEAPKKVTKKTVNKKK